MVSLRLLGGCAVETDERASAGEAGQARRMALLVLLAGARTGRLSREKLIGLLWPDAGSEQARHLLSESLYQLRRALGPQVVIAEGEQIRLNPDAVSCDVAQFEAALERGDLERAVETYDGPFADGFYVRDAPEFERWVEAERRRLADAYGTALERLARVAIARGDHVGAIRSLKRLVAHDPYATRHVIELMQVLATADDPANALLLADEHAQLLRDELGVEPPSELLHCALRIRTDLARASTDGAFHSPRRAQFTDDKARLSRSEEHPTLPHGGAESGRARTHRWGRVLAAAAGVVIAAAAVFTIVRAAPTLRWGRHAPSAQRVAILGFTYRGSDDFRYLGESMSHLLSTTLDGFAGLHTVAPQADDAATGRAGSTIEAQWAREVASRLAAQRVITGDVIEVNGTLRIDARVRRYAEDRDEPEAATVRGPASDFPALTDRLTGQLLVMLVGPVREIHSVAARTTDSLNALKAYLEGVAHRRAGQFDAAFAAFRRAVEIDSTFALAWHGMAVSASWETMPEWDPGMDATLKAVQFSGSLPTHTQLVLQAYAALMHGDGPEAARLARAVLVEHPDDVQGWFTLAWAGNLNPFYGRPVSEVREALERAYRYDPYDPDHQSGAAWFASREGDWARLDSLWGDGFVTRAVRAVGSPDSAALRRVLAAARSTDPDTLSSASGWIAMTLRGIPAAARLARSAATRQPVPVKRALTNVQLAQLEWGLGRWHAAEAALEEVARYDPAWATLYRALWASADFAPVDRQVLERLRTALTDWDTANVLASVTNTGARAHDLLAPHLRLYALGRLSLRLGELDSVLALARQLEAMGSPPAALSFAADRAQSLRAHVAFQRSDYDQALAALEAQPRRIRIQWLYGGTYFYPSPEDRYLRAEILRRLGRDEEALRWYATIQDITPYDVHYYAMAHCMSAETYERLGDPTRAARHYEEYLELWRDADLELRPVVDRARRGLARVESHTGRDARR